MRRGSERRAASPPLKSPAPQQRAAVKASAAARKEGLKGISLDDAEGEVGYPGGIHHLDGLEIHRLDAQVLE